MTYTLTNDLLDAALDEAAWREFDANAMRDAITKGLDALPAEGKRELASQLLSMANAQEPPSLTEPAEVPTLVTSAGSEEDQKRVTVVFRDAFGQQELRAQLPDVEYMVPALRGQIHSVTVLSS